MLLEYQTREQSVLELEGAAVLSLMDSVECTVEFHKLFHAVLFLLYITGSNIKCLNAGLCNALHLLCCLKLP